MVLFLFKTPFFLWQEGACPFDKMKACIFMLAQKFISFPSVLWATFSGIVNRDKYFFWISIIIGSWLTWLVQKWSFSFHRSFIYLSKTFVSHYKIGENGLLNSVNSCRTIALCRDTFVNTFMLQIAVISNHLNGRDTHVRQIKIYGPRP